MQLVVHAPFGQRINRAWGLALRKRFCVRFDFELQAAANDDAILLSLGPQHSFPLDEVFGYVSTRQARRLVEQSVLYTPMFPTRWRWNATRALAVRRQNGAKRVPPYVQRLRSDDLLAAVFPEHVGCQENVTGPLEVPDHALVRQALEDCLNEAMDVPGLIDVLERIEHGAIRLHARDTTEPSPMAHEIVSGKPYTYLDDAPIEERRTRAVALRRALPEDARELAALDPDAIARVREEARPDPRDAEELHEALMSFVAIAAPYARVWAHWLDELASAGRAARLDLPDGPIWFAAENVRLVHELFPEAQAPALDLPTGAAQVVEDREEARRLLLRGHSEVSGPVTAEELARRTGIMPADVAGGLQQLEAGGFLLRGKFSPGASTPEYCDRRLLARIHRYTLERLRREIDPVSAQDLMRFLLRWQHLAPTSRLEGRGQLRTAIEQLQGFEAPAAAWEEELLRPRMVEYRPNWLDELCLSGEAAWGRLTPRRAPANGNGRAAAATRATPITLANRGQMPALVAAVRGAGQPTRDVPQAGAAGEILEVLRHRGALFVDEIARVTGRLPADVESGLRELIGWGYVTSDGFQGLRALVTPARRTAARRGGPRRASQTTAPAGRWDALVEPDPGGMDEEGQAETIVAVLLQRYGVIFRDLVRHESFTVPWRYLLRALRRLEARGVVRGGRFVSGFAGEQYALPEAVSGLRRTRRQPTSGERLRISATDPLNLTGTVLPGPRIPAQAGCWIELVDGVPSHADRETPREQLAAIS